LKTDTKIHVRLIAANAQQQSDPGDAYPIYITDKPPAPPDGLYLHLSANRADASWGQVLGISAYRLYRRRFGETDAAWTLVHEGLDQSFSDRNADGVVTANALPGPENAQVVPRTIYEYAVAAVNGIGEGPRSHGVSTDPAGWQVWWPPNQPEQFKRQSAYWLPPYVPANEVPPPRYP